MSSGLIIFIILAFIVIIAIIATVIILGVKGCVFMADMFGIDHKYLPRRTYSPNGMLLGLFIGVLLFTVTKSILIGIAAGLLVGIGTWIAIFFIEVAITKATKPLEDKLNKKIENLSSDNSDVQNENHGKISLDKEDANTLLKVENICKSFGKEDVLKSVSFDLNKGEVLAIIGSSGGGKTTLLRCLNQLVIPDKGKITVNGDVIFDDSLGRENERNLRTKRLHFGLVFQQFNLFPQYNVFNNLTLAARLLAKENNKKNNGSAEDLKKEYARIDEEAEAILTRVGLKDKMKAYPCELSGGQQQRVAIARALILHPDILCFDEPTSALDPELTGEVLRVIEGLKSSDNTMIIVTHEMEFARRVASKIIFIADGIIEEIGTPEEVFEHPKSEKLKNFFNKSVEVIAQAE